MVKWSWLSQCTWLNNLKLTVNIRYFIKGRSSVPSMHFLYYNVCTNLAPSTTSLLLSVCTILSSGHPNHITILALTTKDDFVVYLRELHSLGAAQLVAQCARWKTIAVISFCSRNNSHSDVCLAKTLEDLRKIWEYDSRDSKHTFFHTVLIWMLLVCRVFTSASNSLNALIEVVLWCRADLRVCAFCKIMLALLLL